MLVGVRGQTTESEGAALREGIIQQPGPFYNGNPSSIIWGNSPTTTPLWREETVSPFAATSSSGFGISKEQQQQHMQTEEKEKDSSEGIMTGEGRASSRGRRHITRAQMARNRNPSPILNPIPSPASSPFAFGFPPQPPQAGPPSSSAPGFGPLRIPTTVASGSSFVAFGSGNNFVTPAAFGTGVAAAAGFLTGHIPAVQDERMEDIEEVIPVMMANMNVNDHPRDSKFAAAKADELTARSGVTAAQGESPSWASPSSKVGAKFSALGLYGSAEPSMEHRKDAAASPGIFVFGAKSAPSNKKGTTPEVPEIKPQPIFQQPPPPTRSRPVKVKRSAPVIKGKGIAAGNINGAFSSQQHAAASSEADRNATGNTSGKPSISSTEAISSAGSFQKPVLASPFSFACDANAGVGEGGNQDGGDNLQSSSSSSSPTSTIELSRVLPKEAAAAVDQQQIPPPFGSFSQAQQSESDPIHGHREPFVFGASRSAQPAPSLSPLFKFVGTATISSFSPSSSSTGVDVSRSASDLLASKHKGSAPSDSTTSQRPQTDAYTMPSFLNFNLGAVKVPVKADGATEFEGILPPTNQQQATAKPPVPPFASGANAKEDSDDNSSYVTAASRFVFSAGSGSTCSSRPTKGASTGADSEQKVNENVSPTESNVTSQFFEPQSWSQPRNANSESFEFEFHAKSGNGSSGNNATAARKKSNRTRGSVPKRQSRSTATSKDKKNFHSFANFVDVPGPSEEAGSPMDFSPQGYTPPDETSHGLGESAKHTAWDSTPSMEKDGLDGRGGVDGDDEWAQYSETDVAIENLRNAANDLTLSRKRGARSSTWEGIRKGEKSFCRIPRAAVFVAFRLFNLRGTCA